MSASWPGEASAPQPGTPASAVACDAEATSATAWSSTAGIAVPADAPVLTVARTRSFVESARTEAGHVTVSVASAAGVQVGPLSIGEVRAIAVTTAHGRPGTTSTRLVRQWCGLSAAGHSEQGCIDPASSEARQFLDQVNAALLQRVQLSVPQAASTATPGGYQAVVTKHPGQRAADQTVNDDDSHTVSALQVVLYNDGSQGRSRLVVQLAGVHAESRYGIIPLPDPFSGPTDGGTGGTPPSPGPAPATGGAPPPAPPPDAGTSGVPDPLTPPAFVDEETAFEVVRMADPVARAPSGSSAFAAGGSRLERIVRVPVRLATDALQVLVQHPREFALLFLTWAMLAAPLYLGARRRTFARQLR